MRKIYGKAKSTLQMKTSSDNWNLPYLSSYSKLNAKKRKQTFDELVDATLETRNEDLISSAEEKLEQLYHLLFAKADLKIASITEMINQLQDNTIEEYIWDQVQCLKPKNFTPCK